MFCILEVIAEVLTPEESLDLYGLEVIPVNLFSGVSLDMKGLEVVLRNSEPENPLGVVE